MEKVLLIANQYAGSVSEWGKEVIVKALRADFNLEVVETEARDHATEIARDASERGFHAVLAFGGDGTVNEVAQGLVGSDTALGILPGGSTNVMARAIGTPREPVRATPYIAHLMQSRSTRRVNVGSISGRYFLFSAGMGLDAEVVKRVEQNPPTTRTRGEWAFLSHALKVAATEYRGRRPGLTVTVEGGDPQRALLVVCCNGRPFTYFRGRPVDVCPEATLDGGLDLFGLDRIGLLSIPRIAWALLVNRSHVRWRRGVYHHDFLSASLEADEPLPVQVDGDYIGEWTSARLSLVPEALDLLI